MKTYNTVTDVDTALAAANRRLAALQSEIATLEARRAELLAENDDFGPLYVEAAGSDPVYYVVRVKPIGARAVQCRTRGAARLAARELLARVPAERWNPDTWATPYFAPEDVLQAVLQVRQLRDVARPR